MQSSSNSRIATNGFNPTAPSWGPVEGNTGSSSDNWRTQPRKAPSKNAWNNKRNTGPAGRNGRSDAQGKPQQAAPQQHHTNEPDPRSGTAVPTTGPVHEFLQLAEAPCFDPELTKSISSLDADVRLASKWLFWIESTEPNKLGDNPSREDYLKTLKLSRSFGNLNKLKEYALQSCDSEGTAKILLFKQGVKPVWEDRGNYNGGRFFIACSNKTVAVNTFMTLLVKLMCGAILPDEEFNGLVVTLSGSNRFAVQVWNKNSSEKDKIKNARKTMKKLFKKNVNYHVHRTSLKINKYGLDAVLPEIEKAEAEKAATRKAAEVVKVPADVIDISAEKETESMAEAVAKAAVAAALKTAWESRPAESLESVETH